MSIELKINTQRGKRYLVITERYWDKEAKKARTKTYQNLGSLEKLQEQYLDPIAHFKEEAKRLNEEFKEKKKLVELKLDMSLTINDNVENTKNIGYVALSKIYHELFLDRFFSNKQRYSKKNFNISNIMKLLVFQRILYPSSKRSTWENKDLFFENSSFSLEDVYRCLSEVNTYSHDIVKHLYSHTLKNYSVEKETLYYDVTNYYFEIDKEDEIRKKGFSKEKRSDPIIQMGLFIDENQIPISYKLFPGNTHDTKTLIPILNEVKNQLGFIKTIVVAGKGLNSNENKINLVKASNGYIFSEKILGANKDLCTFVLDEKDYQCYSSTYRFKSRIVKKPVFVTSDKGRIKYVLEEKQVVVYSEKYANRIKHKRELTLTKANNLIKNISAYNKATHYGAAKYIANLSFDKNTGEILNDVENQLFIDEERIAKEEVFDGYYVIVTSEINKSDSEIFTSYHGLYKIEDQFKITKHEFKTRPVYLSRQDRIEAHFLTCYISLVLIRLLSIKLGNKYSIEQITKSLKNTTVSHIGQNYYVTNYVDEVILEIQKQLGIVLTKKYLSEGDIRTLVGSVKKH